MRHVLAAARALVEELTGPLPVKAVKLLGEESVLFSATTKAVTAYRSPFRSSRR